MTPLGKNLYIVCMRHPIFALSVFISIFLTATSIVRAEDAKPAVARALDNLSSSKIGDFPRKWRTWPMQRSKAAEVYKVAEEGGARFIRAVDDKDASQQIFLNFDWKVKETPLLAWRWRATSVPPGANESNDNTNDSACALYVVVGKYDGHAIKYVWSSTLPVGQVVTRKDGKLKIKVLATGAGGKWRENSVDVRKDYKELFGSDLDKQPSGIGILTDGNAVHKPAGCDYAGFAVAPVQP